MVQIKKNLVWTFILISVSCTSWIRELPKSTNTKNVELSGKYERRTNTKASLTSVYSKNIWTEYIIFGHEKKDEFFKYYESIDTKGISKTIKIILGKGIYQVSGDWILLTTFKKKECINQKESDVDWTNFNHKLLYHYDKKTRTIIPMLYETGYVESNFGVKDGVSEANANSEIFHSYRKIYTEKEYHSHAYYYSNIQK